MTNGSTAPIFLAGVDRSGIGLLGEVLESHSNIAISRRTNFWSFYDRRFGDLRESDNLSRCVAEMMRYRRIRDLQPDADALIEELERGEPTYAGLFAALQEQNLRRLGKARWGDKSLESEGHADTIFREFPDARMIHVIRDPRDRYASRANHRQAGRGRLGAGTAAWLWSVGLAERNQRRYPGRYTVVRYEDLVARPREVVQEVCDFLGERFEPHMLNPRSNPAADESTGAEVRTLHTGSVGRYQRDLPDRQIAFVDLLAGRRMRNFGYRTAPVRLRWRARVAFALVDLPLNTVRLAVSGVGRRRRERGRSRPSARRTVDPGAVAAWSRRSM